MQTDPALPDPKVYKTCPIVRKKLLAISKKFPHGSRLLSQDAHVVAQLGGKGVKGRLPIVIELQNST
jgi:hypothetical protein